MGCELGEMSELCLLRPGWLSASPPSPPGPRHSFRPGETTEAAEATEVTETTEAVEASALMGVLVNAGDGTRLRTGGDEEGVSSGRLQLILVLTGSWRGRCGVSLKDVLLPFEERLGEWTFFSGSPPASNLARI